MEQALRPVPWRACLLVFVVALLFRFGWVVGTDQIHQFPRKEMVRIAMVFAQRGELADPFAAPTGPTALASPVYPVFLGLIFRTFGTGVAAEVVTQHPKGSHRVAEGAGDLLGRTALHEVGA